MTECPFKYSNDIQCMYGKRYKHVEIMSETLVDEDLPEVNLMYIGECYRCVKGTIGGKSVWRYEIGLHSQFWSI